MAKAKKEKDPTEVLLKGVILSFAEILEPSKEKVLEDGSVLESKYKANFLIPKKDTEEEDTHPGAIKNASANMKKLKAAKEAALAKKFGSKPPKLKPEKLCTKDGDLESWDGYEGHWYVSTSNKDQPPIVGKNPKRKIENRRDAEAPYSGCLVNAVVRLYATNNDVTKGGKRVSASLEGVQFVDDGEAFGAAPINPEDHFENLSDDDDDIGEDFEDDDDLDDVL